MRILLFFLLLFVFAFPVFAVDEPAKPATIQSMNPNISVIGNFYYYNTDLPAPNKISPNTMSLGETEVGFETAVDPYADAKFFITLPLNGTPGVEEGYIALNSLPWGLQGKIGKFRSSFGKVNTSHPHARRYADNPFMITNYFGDSLNENGISLSKLIDNPWDIYSELKFELTNGDNTVSFGNTTPRHAMMSLVNWSNFFELSDNSGLIIGLSDAYGMNNASGSYSTNLLGANIQYKYKPDNMQQYFIEAEGLLSNRNSIGMPVNTGGYYAYTGYMPNRYWEYGVRYDSTQSPTSTVWQTSISPIITYRASEFAFYRIQYNAITSNGVSNNEIYVQANFTIGAHGAHAY